MVFSFAFVNDARALFIVLVKKLSSMPYAVRQYDELLKSLVFMLSWHMDRAATVRTDRPAIFWLHSRAAF
jgi:hypothetical protein